MNKLKFIPVLAVVSLLSACGQSSTFVTVKAPKFEKEGQEIEVEDFFKGVDTNVMALDFNNNKRMSSKEIITEQESTPFFSHRPSSCS